MRIGPNSFPKLIQCARCPFFLGGGGAFSLIALVAFFSEVGGPFFSYLLEKLVMRIGPNSFPKLIHCSRCPFFLGGGRAFSLIALVAIFSEAGGPFFSYLLKKLILRTGQKTFCETRKLR